MKKNRILIIVLLVILVISLVGIFLYKKYKSENIKDMSKLWYIYELNVDEIKNNIAKTIDYKENTVCGNIKDIKIKDESYELALNELACYINLYYYNLTEYNENYHNYIISYKDKTKISKKDILILKDNLKKDTFFYNNLKNILLYKFEENDKKDMLFKEINKYLSDFNPEYYDNKNLTYKEIFTFKLSEISYVAHLSNLVNEEVLNIKLGK